MKASGGLAEKPSPRHGRPRSDEATSSQAVWSALPPAGPQGTSASVEKNGFGQPPGEKEAGRSWCWPWCPAAWRAEAQPASSFPEQVVTWAVLAYGKETRSGWAGKASDRSAAVRAVGLPSLERLGVRLVLSKLA